MTAWVSTHAVGVLLWIFSISWLFHVYLLAGAAARGDTLARNWELVATLGHLAAIAVVLALSYHRRNHDDAV